MLIKRKHTRRRFLQGFGGSLLALPLLEANSSSGILSLRRNGSLQRESFMGLYRKTFIPTNG